MRSANEALAQMAWIAIAGVYGLAGTVGGMFYLLRRGALSLPRFTAQPAKWALFMSMCTAGTLANQLPMTWMTYDTAVSLQVQYSKFAVNIVATMVFHFMILWLTFTGK
jgi:hypothetical protein